MNHLQQQNQAGKTSGGEGDGEGGQSGTVSGTLGRDGAPGEIRPGFGRMEAASWASVLSWWSSNPSLISLHPQVGFIVVRS